MHYFFLTILFFLLGSISYAQEIRELSTKAGQTYVQVTIQKVEPDGIRIFHSEGAIKIPFSDLSEDIQKQFNYGEKTAAELVAANKKAEQEREQTHQTKQLNKNEKLSKSLDFKGLKLRLPIEDVGHFLKSSLWCYDRMGVFLGRKPDLSKQNQTIKLQIEGPEDAERKGFSKEQRNAILTIGRRGVGDEMKWHIWESAYATFFDGKIAEIKVYGTALPADQFKTRTLDWLQLAEMGLTEKYGEPKKRFFQLSDFNILKTETRYIKFISRWKVGDQTITTGVVEDDFRYAPVILYSDETLSARMEAASAGKSGL